MELVQTRFIPVLSGLFSLLDVDFSKQSLFQIQFVQVLGAFSILEKNGFISVCTVNFTVSMPSNIKALNGAQLMCIVFQTNID